MGCLKWSISIDHFGARFFFALKPVIVNIAINIVGSKKWAKIELKAGVFRRPTPNQALEMDWAKPCRF